MSISVIIPTIARPALGRTLGSVLFQLDEDDEVLVVSDGGSAKVEDLCSGLQWAESGACVRYLKTRHTGDSGATQRDAGIAAARGTHLMFVDDDDVFTPDALNAARKAIAERPQAAHIFQMRYGSRAPEPGLVLWRTPEVVLCNVGTPMFVVPRDPDYMPAWAGLSVQYHDFEWISRVARRCPPTFHRHVIAIIRPGDEVTE